MNKTETHNSRERAEERREERKRRNSILNKAWLWIGVIVLVAILLYWLFAIGTFEGPNQ